jgi:hypothetical protein
VERAEDDRVLRSVLGEGTTTVIKGTRQIGKSSLLARSIAAAKRAGLKAFYLDFQTLEPAHLKDLNCLLKFLSRRVAKEFRIPEHPDGFWDDDDGPKIGLSDFLKRDILTTAAPRTVFLFDEVDRVFEHPEYRDDFFGTLRFWHNERANDPETWDRLNLVIAHSPEPSLWIQDIHQSPFNVGDRVRLRDFQLGQVADLNQRYGSPLKNDAEISQLIRLVGGHPYLVRQAFYSMVSYGWSLAELDTHASESDGPFGDHLKRYIWGLSKDTGLKSALIRILQTGRCDDESHFQRLSAVGLIQGGDRQSARLRSQVYETYFRRHL